MAAVELLWFDRFPSFLEFTEWYILKAERVGYLARLDLAPRRETTTSLMVEASVFSGSSLTISFRVMDITNELEDLFFLGSLTRLLRFKRASGCPAFDGTLPAHVIHKVYNIPFFTLALSYGLPGNNLADSVHSDLRHLRRVCLLCKLHSACFHFGR